MFDQRIHFCTNHLLISRLEQRLAAAEARAKRLEALYREARRAHCYSLTIDHNVREDWKSEFDAATEAAIKQAKEGK